MVIKARLFSFVFSFFTSPAGSRGAARESIARRARRGEKAGAGEGLADASSALRAHRSPSAWCIVYDVSVGGRAKVVRAWADD